MFEVPMFLIYSCYTMTCSMSEITPWWTRVNIYEDRYGIDWCVYHTEEQIKDYFYSFDK